MTRRAAFAFFAALAVSAFVQAASIDGVWTGDVGGRNLVVVLRERAGGRLIGALPAEPGSSIAGTRVGRNVTLTVTGADPGGPFSRTFEGSLVKSTLSFPGPPALTLRKSTEPRRTVHWLMAAPFGEITRTARFARLEDGAGAFFSGSFVNLETCDFIGCGGSVTGWSIAGTAHSIATSSGETCVKPGSLTGTFDPGALLLEGTWSRSAVPCAPEGASGSFFGGKEGLAPISDVELFLATLQEFGDEIEAESSRAMRAFSTTYLHDGTTRADWEARLANAYESYGSLEARIEAIGQIVTQNDAEVFPDVQLPARAEWRLVVTGIPLAGGPRETVPGLDLTSRFAGAEELFWIGSERGSIVFTGNGEGAPFTIVPPLAAGDEARTTYGVLPYGIHDPSHTSGHPGWDFELAADAFVRAAAAGTVVARDPHPGIPGQWDLRIEHRPGYFTLYHHLRTLEPGIVLGATVASGQALGLPGSFPPLHMTHFGLNLRVRATCPLPFLSTTGRTFFDSLWARAAYGQELVEPYPCNPIEAAPPFSRTWTRTDAGAGLSPDAVSFDFTRADASSGTRYVMRGAGGTALESGDVAFTNPVAEPAGMLELAPDGGAPRHYARYDVLDGTLRIRWSDTGFPADLTGAATFTTPP